uniref:Protein Cep78 homolog n=1 Tax=Glossina palpalis gambiensis TaxID=67801 RepID=A0A1B0B4Y5_9MUSC
MHKFNNLELREVASGTTSTKKINRCRSFHFRYLELCRAKNLTPVPDIKAKNNATSVLDFFGDKLAVNDWLLIVEALYYDQVLQNVGIRMRKAFGMAVLDHLDTEKKAKLFRQRPVIYTKFVFSGVVEAISNCIEFNKNLRILNLEGLPLSDKYVESIAKAVSTNESLKEISFQRSYIYDKGCEAICNTIKYLEHVEKLNLSECELTTKGAECVADMIKIQKISRYTEGWQKSLRYRDVDPDTIPGLRNIALSGNTQIGDDGLKCIVEVLKEDVWIKVIDMEQCGLTDRAANMILDCLEINNYIIDFNVRNNNGISKFLQRSIRDQLGKDDEDQKLMDGQTELVAGPNGVVVKRAKGTLTNLKEQLKTLEEQLAFERMLRKKAELLNEKLNQQIIAYENQLENESKANVPDGYVVVKNESLQSIIKERNDFQKIIKPSSAASTPRKNINICLNKEATLGHHQQTYINVHDDDDGEETENESNDPERQVHLNSPVNGVTANLIITQKETRKALKVRKVKSEMKYAEPPTVKESAKKKESKSDHELANETDFQLSAVHFETNIGDTMSNSITDSSRSQNSSKTLTNAPVQPHKDKRANYVHSNNTNNSNNNSNSNAINNNVANGKNNLFESLTKFELDEISIPTTRSISSDLCSSDSDTLRDDNEYQPMKVFIRRAKPMPLTPMPQNQHHDIFDPNVDEAEFTKSVKSPRSLFLGLCNE